MSEKLGRDIIRQVIGLEWPAAKISFSDITSLRDKAIRNFSNYPSRMRLPGMITDLNDSDRRVLANFEAAVELLNNLGVLNYDRFMALWAPPYTEVHEVIDEGVVGHTFTEQKKNG